MTAPRVSVLIPCFNAERYVAETIESVLAQTHPGVEIIVVDDGSTDKSTEILNRYSGRGVRVFQQANQGAAAARNHALREARGDWCLFLDADDLLEREFVETQVHASVQGSADICFGCSVMTWPDGRRIEKDSMPREASIDTALSHVLFDKWYPPNAILWRTAFVRQIGGWDETVSLNDDGELIARALLRDPVITSSTGSRAIYRQHSGPDRISARKDRSAVEASVRVPIRVHQALDQRPELTLARKALGRQLAEKAYEAFYLGHPDLGREAEAHARQIGLIRRTGGLLHKLGCATLGAETKANLSKRLHMSKARLLG